MQDSRPRSRESAGLDERILSLGCLIFSVILFALVLFDLDFLGGMERKQVVGRLTTIDKNTSWEDLDGHIRIDDGTRSVRVSMDVNPKDDIAVGDLVRARYLDTGWLSSRLLRLEVIEGEVPGTKLDISSHRPGPMHLAVTIFAIVVCGFGVRLWVKPG